MSRRVMLCAAFLAAAGTALISTASIANQGDTERVSVSSAGEQSNDWSASRAISGDGRYVAFHALASNLVTGDTNGFWDVFVHDRVAHKTVLVSVSSSGVHSNNNSFDPTISGDGRYVAFWSDASNLVTGDTNNCTDVFVHDQVTGETIRISVSAFGEQGDGISTAPSISADGRYIAFDSDASNLIPGDTNSTRDVFVHDLVTDATERVSVSSAGAQGNGCSCGPSISADGRCVAFQSDASNLVPGDTNGQSDVFVRDRVIMETERVSISSAGEQGNNASLHSSISADGRYIAFDSYAQNLMPGGSAYSDVFVHDRVTMETECISVSSTGDRGNIDSYFPSISADGRRVAFTSEAWNVVPDDRNNWPDVFAHDQVTGETVLVSVSSSGEQGTWWSRAPAISSDGCYVAFESGSTNLVPGDTNDYWDVFVHQYLPNAVKVSAPDGWLNPGWNYFSIPLDPISWPEASYLLGFDCKNILYRWDPVRKSFELYPDDFTDLARGRGYILRLATDEQPSYDAYPPGGDFEIAIPEAGRIMIGQPFDHNTLLEDCLIRNNATGTTRTASDDKAAGSGSWLNWNLVWWDSTGESWKILSMSGGDDTYLRPWHGYNVWANMRDLTFIVPEE